VLLASGYIAGGAIAGILFAVLNLFPNVLGQIDVSKSLPAWWNEAAWPSLFAFGLTVLILVLVGTGHLLQGGGVPEAVEEGLTAREEDL
jgi:hypothetical protein